MYFVGISPYFPFPFPLLFLHCFPPLVWGLTLGICHAIVLYINDTL